MNVLFITNNLPPLVDGVGDYTYNLAREFAKHGHEVHVVCRDKEEIRDNYADIHVAKIVRKWNRQAGKDIAEYIRKHKIEVISLQYVPHGFHPKGLPFGLISVVNEIKKTNVKLMVFCHEVSVEYSHGTLKQKVLEYLMKGITRKILGQANLIATSIAYYREMIIKIGIQQPVSIIPIASNIPIYNYTVKELSAIKQKIAPHGEYIVSFFGKRDITTSCRAINELINDGVPIQSLMIGSVKIDNKCKLVNCYKTGVLKPENLYKFFLVSDLMILPENQITGCSFKSGSLIASLRAGLPVITTNGYMTDTSLNDKINILFADFSSCADIKEKILLLLYDRQLYYRIKNNAKDSVSRSNWQEVYNRYIGIF